MPRPLTRLRLVLPKNGSGVEALAQRMADALAVHGVQVRQQIAGAAPDGAPRADVALWLPDVDGSTPACDPRVAPARVQAALVVDPSTGATPVRNFARYDALVVPHDALVAPLKAAVRRGARDIPISVARLPGDVLMAREAEKALRGVSGRRVVLVDVREGFEGDIERVVVQLALKGQTGALVLLAPHDERARARIRALCERHAVDAYLASGNDAFALSIGAIDVVIGRPSWDELLLAALHRVPVALLPMDKRPALLDPLSAGRVVDEVLGMLQLAAAIDRLLADPGALDARGLALREALFGPERPFVDALATLEPTPHGAASTWEQVGPHGASGAGREAPVVDAKTAPAPATGSDADASSRAQRIEDALEALKQKIAQG